MKVVKNIRRKDDRMNSLYQLFLIRMYLPNFLVVGLNRTSRPVPVVEEFSNVWIPDFRFFPSRTFNTFKVQESLRFLFFKMAAFFLLKEKDVHMFLCYDSWSARLKHFLKSNCQVGGRGKD